MVDRRTFLSQSAVAASLLAAGPLSIAKAATSGTEGEVVTTAAGKIRGAFENKVHAFKGIPYAAPPVGPLRFMPPAKAQPWTGVRDALTLGPEAPQTSAEGLVPDFLWAMIPKNPAMSEDCLHLHVWTPAPGDGHKRPVMVWLHGGGFASGSANWPLYDGGNLAAKQDVVVVGVNHRLNVFGFTYLADLGGEKYANASNVGMLDTVAALEWVRDNIAAFGGDPGNVTIFGESGGGAKVCTLLAMPSAKGLFHRAIVQSSASLRGTPRADATKSAEAFLATLKLKPNQVDELQKLSMAQLLDAMKASRGLRLAPVVDGHSLPANPFDPVAPEVSANVPLLLGNTRTEITGLIVNMPFDPIDDATLLKNVKQTLRADDAAAEKLIAAWKTSEPKASNLDRYLEIASYNVMRADIVTAAERKVALGKAPVYMYLMTWTTPIDGGKLGTPHTLDLPFVFANVGMATAMTGDGQDRFALSDKMSGAWAAFARAGAPEYKGLPHWPAYNASSRATMILDNQCKVVNDPHREERLAFDAFRASHG